VGGADDGLIRRRVIERAELLEVGGVGGVGTEDGGAVLLGEGDEDVVSAEVGETDDEHGGDEAGGVARGEPVLDHATGGAVEDGAWTSVTGEGDDAGEFGRLRGGVLPVLVRERNLLVLPFFPSSLLLIVPLLSRYCPSDVPLTVPGLIFGALIPLKVQDLDDAWRCPRTCPAQTGMFTRRENWLTLNHPEPLKQLKCP
jgi:hypothetical protein